MKEGKCAIWKPINLLSYLLSTNDKLHAPHDAKCKMRHKSYPGSYKLPKTYRKKKKSMQKQKPRSKMKGMLERGRG